MSLVVRYVVLSDLPAVPNIAALRRRGLRGFRTWEQLEVLPGTATERSAQVVKMTECLHTEERGRGLEPGLNYGAWRDNVSPDWKHTNWKVEALQQCPARP